MRGLLKSAINSILSRKQRDSLLGYLASQSPVAFAKLAHQMVQAPHQKIGFQKLSARGLKPQLIVDAGAYQGHWSQFVHTVWPDAKQIMIEANSEKRALLENVAESLGATLHMTLLGPDDDVERTFYVMESGSSILEENSPLDRCAKTVTTRRLDSVIPAHTPVDFLKVDVQGYELEVLRGAPRILSEVQAVLLEVALLQINKGAPLFAEVVAFMKSRGFEVCDVLELHHRPLDKATNQVDLLFVPKESPLMQDTRHF